jgi:hypothetical protein
MKIGVCKLCLQKRPLCQSHLIPRAVYNICRARKAANPNPLLVTHKFAMQTSRQLKVPLLCLECEQLLRARGEDWTIPELARLNQQFLLFEKLKAAQPAFVQPDFVAYFLEAVPTIHVPELVHFAMGIFWKASTHSWAKGRRKPWADLGELPRESIRRFILGETEFPDQMALSLTILPPPKALIAFNYPYATKGPDPTFHLYVSGINCTLWIGCNVPENVAVTSIHRPPHLLLVVDNVRDITRKFREALQSAEKARQLRKEQA